jgi:hypothetical protein
MLAVQLVGREEEKVIIACQRTVELATHTPKAHTEKKKVTACVHRVNSSTSDVVTLENEQHWLIRLAVSSSLLAALREIIHFRGSSIARAPCRVRTPQPNEQPGRGSSLLVRTWWSAKQVCCARGPWGRAYVRSRGSQPPQGTSFSAYAAETVFPAMHSRSRGARADPAGPSGTGSRTASHQMLINHVTIYIQIFEHVLLGGGQESTLIELIPPFQNTCRY